MVGIITSVILVVVGIIATFIYDGQLREMRHTNELTQQALNLGNDTLKKTLEKMQGQIDAAKTANNLSKQSIVATQSASVIVESPRPTPLSMDVELLKQQGLYLYFANVGVSPSGRFAANAVLIRRRLPEFTIIGEPQRRTITSPRIMPGERMPSGIPGFRTDDVHLSFETTSFTSRDVALIASFNEVAQINGSFSYEDGFGNVRRQPFCFLYAIFPRHIFAESGATTGGGEGSWGMCGDMKHYVVQAENWRAKDQKVRKHN